MNPISCLDAWQDGENVWLSNYDYNALIRWNMDSGEAEIMGLFPRSRRVQEDYIGGYFVWEKSCILFPIGADISISGIWNREHGSVSRWQRKK